MVSQSLEQQSGLDEFLANLSQGQASTEGRFTVASEEMFRKLRLAISDTAL